LSTPTHSGISANSTSIAASGRTAAARCARRSAARCLRQPQDGPEEDQRRELEGEVGHELALARSRTRRFSSLAIFRDSGSRRAAAPGLKYGLSSFRMLRCSGGSQSIGSKPEVEVAHVDGIGATPEAEENVSQSWAALITSSRR